MEEGGLRVIYDTMPAEVTIPAGTSESGYQVSESPNSIHSTGCLGLMADGMHGFVHNPSASWIPYHLRMGKATVLGSQYLWDRQAWSRSASLIWRTVETSSPATGWSGSVLCLGKPSDTTSTGDCIPALPDQVLLAPEGEADRLTSEDLFRYR